jgi:3-ketosteroid 9alpha-monooxygenase subunit A
MATTKEYRLGDFTFPRGWFMIATAEDINTHKPVAVRFFGKDFALYRGRATGRVVLLDAYCPHMKTHLAAENDTSYVIIDGGGTNIEGDSIRCPYHAWRFGPDGQCDDIPYHDGPIPKTACVKSWQVVESMGAIWIWHDPENGEPQWDHPSLPQWDDKAWVHWAIDDLGELEQHPQEVIDNIADYSHLSPIHGSTVERFENEFIGHRAIQRQCGPHRTLVGEDGANPILHTITTYHGPGVLLSKMSGYCDAYLMISHTPVDDGKVHVWHAVLVKSPNGNAVATVEDKIAAQQFSDASLHAFEQDFQVWANKAPCFNGLFLPSDGPFMKARMWYKQFYNPVERKEEYLKKCEGLYVPKGTIAYTSNDS